MFRAGYGRTADPTGFIDFRNAYPINFVWAMAPVRLNGVDNAYLPVTTFRQGLVPPTPAP